MDNQFNQVITNITKDPHCVGIGEFGLDYSEPFVKFKTLQIYVKEMFNKILVIHCRDQKNTDASTTCLKIINEEIPGFYKEVVNIHYHCYNRGMSTP